MSADKEPQAVVIIEMGGAAWALPERYTDAVTRACAAIAASGVRVNSEYKGGVTEWRSMGRIGCAPNIRFTNHILPAKPTDETEADND